MRLTHACLFIAAACATSHAAVWGPPCTAEQDCLGGSLNRCLDSGADKVGAPCTLDYAFNETGLCSCGAQTCVPLTDGAKTSKKQLLVIGDSISLGLFSALAANLTEYEVVHAPSFPGGNNNCDNVNWGNLCVSGWLSSNASRWDAIYINHGLHDLAFPDNEHIDVSSYYMLLASELAIIRSTIKASATVTWMTITPVPTNPPPACVLIPGRIESDVLIYNTAALQAVAVVPGVQACDLHKVITDYCGVGYSNCSITQCGGPHFNADGFTMLGNAAAGCIRGQGLMSLPAHTRKNEYV